MNSRHHFLTKIAKIIDEKGIDSQYLALAEELAELITVTNQYRRNRKRVDDVLEEIADSLIMIGEFMYLLDISPMEVKRKIILKLKKFQNNKK